MTIFARICPALRALSCAALLSLGAPGCGWIVGEIAEQMHKERALKNHVYKDTPAEKLWAEVNQLWVAQGCEAIASPELATTYACTGGEGHWVRVDARDGGFHVEFEREQEVVEVEPEAQAKAEGAKTETKKERVRDWELEWKLLERLDHETAKRILAEAEARKNKARKATKQLDEALSPDEG